MSFYAVKNGRRNGIFDNWAECNEQVHRYPGAEFRKFKHRVNAEKYLGGHTGNEKNIKPHKEAILKELKYNEMVAYVDGSTTSGEESSFSWGIVTFSKDFGKIRINGRSTDEKLTKYKNVAGELMGAMEAVKFAINNNMSKITIHYDFTGIRHWALGEWKPNNCLAKSYQKFYNDIKGIIDYDFVKVKSHSGNEFNNEADRLARKAIGL